MSALSEVLRALAEADRARADALERLAAVCTVEGAPDWVPQTDSPLGARRHCRLVRELVEAKSPDAAIRGRRHLLRRSRVELELRGPSAPAVPLPRPERPAQGLARELGLRVIDGGDNDDATGAA